MKTYIFGTTMAGESVPAYILENEYLQVEVLAWGATIRRLYVKALQRDVVLGYDDFSSYERNEPYLGASIGPVANRLAYGKYCWQGEERQLSCNAGSHHLHSAEAGLSHRLWGLKESTKEGQLCLQTTLDGSAYGYPASLTVVLRLALVGMAVELQYAYVTAEDSFVNLTNHGYFNLQGQGTVENHTLWIPASLYTPMDESQIPRESVEPLPPALDFREEQKVGLMLAKYADILAPFKGYDHNYIVRPPKGYAVDCQSEGGIPQRASLMGTGKLSLCGRFEVEDLSLQIFSDAPAFQLYTGNWLNGTGKKGERYEAHSGMCIEPQFTPNDINMMSFRESFTEKDKKYLRTILYDFALP